MEKIWNMSKGRLKRVEDEAYFRTEQRVLQDELDNFNKGAFKGEDVQFSQPIRGIYSWRSFVVFPRLKLHEWLYMDQISLLAQGCSIEDMRSVYSHRVKDVFPPTMPDEERREMRSKRVHIPGDTLINERYGHMKGQPGKNSGEVTILATLEGLVEVSISKLQTIPPSQYEGRFTEHMNRFQYRRFELKARNVLIGEGNSHYFDGGVEISLYASPRKKEDSSFEKVVWTRRVTSMWHVQFCEHELIRKVDEYYAKKNSHVAA